MSMNVKGIYVIRLVRIFSEVSDVSVEMATPSTTTVSHALVMYCISCIFPTVTSLLFAQTDVDECADTTKCSQICVNTDGSFFCSCSDGYYLADDQTQCLRQGGEDIELHRPIVWRLYTKAIFLFCLNC